MKRSSMSTIWHKYDPAVGKPTLLLLAGILWMGVGIMLCTFAIVWLKNFGEQNTWWLASIGTLTALLIHHFGFLRIVDKNLGRIRKIDGKYCAFGFMPLKSYGIIAIMMTMGIMLRHSSIPKQYLSVLYVGIGLALILSSVRYFRFWMHRNEEY